MSENPTTHDEIPILMYHYLGDAKTEEDGPYVVSEKTFRSQMSLLSRLKYRSISLSELLSGLNGGASLPDRSVVITFDDGHESFYEIGGPILTDLGFSATMFVITNRVGEPGYMSWPQIRDMDAVGMSFQSHSVSHPILTQIPEEKVSWELSHSKETLEAELCKPVHAFAYRGGHYNHRVKTMVEEAGYRSAVTTQWGFNTRSVDRFAMKRNAIRERHTGASFVQRLSPGYAASSFRARVSYLLGR